MENVQRIDLHALIPRFASLRLRDAARLGRLVDSIARQGQLMPVVGVPEAGTDGHWVLIDGYRRLQALQRLGQVGVREADVRLGAIEIEDHGAVFRAKILEVACRPGILHVANASAMPRSRRPEAVLGASVRASTAHLGDVIVHTRAFEGEVFCDGIGKT